MLRNRSKPRVRLMRATASIVALGALGGCGTLMPYEDDFACKNEDYGQCIHPELAYRNAVSATAPDAASTEAYDIADGRKRKKDHAKPVLAAAHGGYAGYTEAVYDQLTTLIEAPQTPMMAPAKTVRTLILPYADQASGGRLYMPRFVFSVLEQPRFVLGDYLAPTSRDLAGVIANGLLEAPRTMSAPSPAAGAAATPRGYVPSRPISPSVRTLPSADEAPSPRLKPSTLTPATPTAPAVLGAIAPLAEPIAGVSYDVEETE